RGTDQHGFPQRDGIRLSEGCRSSRRLQRHRLVELRDRHPPPEVRHRLLLCQIRQERPARQHPPHLPHVHIRSGAVPAQHGQPVKQAVASLLIVALFMSCAASLPYATDYPLTEQTFRSRDGVFSARVPRGWFSSTGDTLVPALVAWLVKDDL